MITRPSSTPAGSPRNPAARRSRCTAERHSRRTPARPTGSAIAALKAHVSIPVLGNGDIWEAADALRMISQTGVDGVVIGRGCLGRPWLFRDLADAFAGRQTPDSARTSARSMGMAAAACRAARWRCPTSCTA